MQVKRDNEPNNKQLINNKNVFDLFQTISLV